MSFTSPSLYVLAVPQFEDNEVPDNLSIVFGVLFAMPANHLVKKRRLKIAPLASARIIEDVLHERFKPWVLQKPKRHRNAKPMFLFAEDLGRQYVPHCLLEDISLAKSFQFQACRYPS